MYLLFEMHNSIAGLVFQIMFGGFTLEFFLDKNLVMRFFCLLQYGVQSIYMSCVVIFDRSSLIKHQLAYCTKGCSYHPFQTKELTIFIKEDRSKMTTQLVLTVWTFCSMHAPHCTKQKILVTTFLLRKDPV